MLQMTRYAFTLHGTNVLLSDRGTIWGTITFHGKAAHGSMPGLGINALQHACSFVHLATSTIGPMLAGLSDDRVIPPEARVPSLTFTVLHAGDNINSVPDIAVVSFDRRIVPAETLAEARQQIFDVLKSMKEMPEFAELDYDYKEDYETEATWVDPDQLISRVFRDAIKVVTGQEAGIVVSPGTDDQVCRPTLWTPDITSQALTQHDICSDSPCIVLTHLS